MNYENRPCKSITAITLLAAGSLLSLLGGPGVAPVRAQDASPAAASQPVTLNVENAPVQTVLKTLFAGKNYQVARDVQGTVSVNLSGVSFDVALRSVLRAANPPLTFDIVDGVYQIKVKRATPAIQPATTAPVTNVPEAIHTYKIPIDSYDAYYIASIMGASRNGVTTVMPNYVNPGAGAGSADVNNNGRGGNGRNGNRQGRGGAGGRRRGRGGS